MVVLDCRWRVNARGVIERSRFLESAFRPIAEPYATDADGEVVRSCLSLSPTILLS